MYAANVYDIRRATEAGAPVLTRRRLHRRATIACALVCALVAPAVSSAQDDRASAPTSSLAGTTSASQDHRSPGLAAAVSTSSLAGTTSAPSQDLRSADNRDAARRQGTLGAPDVTVAKLPQPAPVHGNPGIDRRDAVIGAGTVFGLMVLGLAGATAIVQRRRRAPRTAATA
jgi:hypothetical protein